MCFGQLSPADHARYQQQMAAMQQTARQMQERARQTALENERRMREMRERQEALMQRQREQAAQNLARQREGNEGALERQRQMNQVGKDLGDAIRQGEEKSQQRLEEYHQRQQLNREKMDDALTQMSSNESNAPRSLSPGSQQDTATARASSSKSYVNDELKGEKFSQTRTRVISDEEAGGMSFAKLRYAINEIYARHGADFASKPELRSQFDQF